MSEQASESAHDEGSECPYDNRECGWFGCHRPECEQFCAGLAPDLDYWDCTCGHPKDDHNLGECPFIGCGCGVLDVRSSSEGDGA